MSYSFYRPVTIDKTKIGETDANFAVCLNLTADGSGVIADLRTVANGGDIQNTCAGGAGGGLTIPADLVFRTSVDLSDAGTNIPHEVEYYDATTGALVVHVKCGVNTSSDVVIYMIYGNSAITTNQEQITSAWDSNFKGVWHLGGDGDAYDSTTNPKTLTNHSTVATTGKIGGGRSLNGSNQYLSISDVDSGGKFDVGAQLTLEAWVRKSNTNTQGAAVSKYYLDGVGSEYVLEFWSDDSYEIDLYTTSRKVVNVVGYLANTWYHVVATYDGSGIRLYRDGVLTGGPTAHSGNLVDSAKDFMIGALGSSPVTRYWGGDLDEVRISNVARTANHITTCYDDKTEVLTNQGWHLFKDLNGSELVATINQATGKLEYQKPTNYIAYPYQGRLFTVVNSRTLDLAVIPDHNMYVSSKGDREWSDYELVRAGDIFDKVVRYKKDAVWIGQEEESFVLPSVKLNDGKRYVNDGIQPSVQIDMDLWLEFLGYFLSEGYVGWENSNGTPKYTVVISQCPRANPEKWHTIKICLDRLPFKYAYKDRHFSICSKQLSAYLRQFGKDDERFVPQKIKGLSKRQLLILLDALLLGDGSANTNGHGAYYATISKQLADDIQEILLKVGWAGTITETGHNENHRTLYRIGIIKRWLRPIVDNRDKAGRKARNTWIDYDGYVYSVAVPNRTLYVRRNGKAVWSGNCYNNQSAPGTFYSVGAEQPTTSTSSSTSTSTSTTSTSTSITISTSTSTSTSSTTTSTSSTTTSTSSTTTSSSTSSSSTSSTSTSTSTTTTSSSTSTTTSASTSSSTTTTSSSTSTTSTSSSSSTLSTTSTSTSTTTSTSSSTTTTIGPAGIAWGVQEPLAGEAACSWAVWSDGAGGKPVIQYDPNWGKIKLETSQVGHSNVIDTGDTQNKTLTVTPDVYGAGSGVGGVYIRGQATSFNQDAALPAWELYSGPVTKAWRWIQVKLTGPVDG